MKKIALILMCLILIPLAHAGNKSDIPLDKIIFQISAKQWVTTQTALLSVDINATLSSADLVKARADIMSSLNKIAQGDWQLTRFDRSQDSSGLEKLTVNAQARVPQEALTDVYNNAKSVSKPGANYSIANVEFKPSLEEIQNVRGKIREQLYQQINNELKRINKNYPGQNYSLSQLIFMEGDQPIQPKAFQAREMNAMVMAATPAPQVSVSNELIMTAMVVVASNRTTED
ncbi:hypothetical protein [Legionella israelensis]|uniref:DUF541 domain-containing protein n=1 Tax=Legionella israelensis TaxID=454 RepID=A0A0W0V559_9GAMM|nr:hypothetical protein [Legionella israelensis]KTD14982.1 hypothetical protein Lisr_2327 [Legionella israelensis]QBS11122.1 hypothetical protein E4T55_09245 [Legionella israelensis]SCX78316.1 hypothetical protein SAMN02746069_00161 [Legionella israelensis DSM 19235]STX59602.1 Predicted periplasmic/secreted protein [Legionella israelensis]